MIFREDPTLRSRIIGAFGNEGEQWLARLPKLIDARRAEWQIDDLKQATGLSYSWIGFGLSVFGPVCLKLSVPNPESLSEIVALHAFGETRRIARLYLSDPTECAILEERISPGDSLWTVSHPARLAIAAKAMASLHSARLVRSALEFVPHAADQADRAFARARTDGAPTALLDAIALVEPIAARLRDDLTLIHGDLHHANMLAHAHNDDVAWRVIDPKGIAAPLWLEPARYILNELWETDQANARDLWHELVNGFAGRLGLELRDVAAGSALDAALSTCWSVEEAVRRSGSSSFPDELETRSGLALSIARWATAVR